LIDEKATNGRLRSWAAFTYTAAEACRRCGADQISRPIVESAITQLGAG